MYVNEFYSGADGTLDVIWSAHYTSMDPVEFFSGLVYSLPLLLTTPLILFEQPTQSNNLDK